MIMRVVIAGILFSSLVLAACGTNQTGQTNNQQPLVKKDNVIEIEKQSTAESTTGMVMPQSNMSESSVENTGTEQVNSEVVVETASDNAMLKDSGIQAEVEQAVEENTAVVMEEGKKEIAEQKEEAKKQIIEPKS